MKHQENSTPEISIGYEIINSRKPRIVADTYFGEVEYNLAGEVISDFISKRGDFCDFSKLMQGHRGRILKDEKRKKIYETTDEMER